ncbi:uracil-DNA glycosylase [bacterium]|nr:uracil-DNA glycosylase [bacterium]
MNCPSKEIQKIITDLKAHLKAQHDAGLEWMRIPKENLNSLIMTGFSASIQNCNRCRLARSRNNIVFGEGNTNAKLMFIGESPGMEEDHSGRPFVGKSGMLLTRIIQAINLSREEVFITSVIKCRPPENRPPEPDEIAACEPFLIQQIEVIRPAIICTLGSVAAHTLLKTEKPITKLRGAFHEFSGIKVMPTFHPAYLLRNPKEKKLVWDDMQKIRDMYQRL